MRRKKGSFILALVCVFMMLAAAGCAREAQSGSDMKEETEVQEETAPQDEQADVAVENTEPSETIEKVEYSHEDIYLSLTIPDGWDYEIKTVEELEKYDGMAICAVEFWKEDYPETVFTFAYESSFGICDTGVTIDEFTQENGINGSRYTEEIGDTLWFAMTFWNPEDVDEEKVYKGGTYCIMASPKLSEWDAIEPEFEEIVETIWVGSH